jgi:hypothetical protein
MNVYVKYIYDETVCGFPRIKRKLFVYDTFYPILLSFPYINMWKISHKFFFNQEYPVPFYTGDTTEERLDGCSR